MLNILITGASGFIGSNLIRSLSEKNNISIYCLVRNVSDIQRGPEKIKYISADLTDGSFTATLPDNIHIVIHLAQSSNYRQFPSKADDIFNVNVRSTQMLLDWGVKTGIKKFIFASSGNVYKQQNKLLNENDLCEPMGYYGATKLSAEHLVKSYNQFFDTSIIRIFGVYGPGQKSMTIPNIILKVKNNEEVILASNAGLFFTPLYIDDCINMLEKIIFNTQKLSPSVYNIAGNETIDLLTLVNKIGDITGMKARTKLTDSPPTYLMGDITRFRTDFDYHYFTSFNKGITETLKHETIKY